MARYSAIVRPNKSLELPQEARWLVEPGQQVSIDLAEPLQLRHAPNYAALAMLEELAERQKDRRETYGSETDKIIREGRACLMHGFEYAEP